MQKTSVFITYLLTATAILIFLFAGVPRLFFPYESHWMEGSMLDAVSRILSGIPLYTRPSIHYVPWLYEPFYYYVTAGIGYITGLTFFTARLPSVFSVIGISVILYKVVHNETHNATLAISAIGLFIASYAKTEFCFLTARVDPLFTFFIFSAFVTIYYFRSNSGIILGAVLLSLGYFTKQTSLVFAPSLILYLWYFRGWKIMLLFTGTMLITLLAGIYTLNLYYDGWFNYYTLTVPGGKSKELRWGYAMSGFIIYVILRCWPVTTILSVVPLKSFFSRSNKRIERSTVYFSIFFLISMIAGFLGILNNGGGHNVFLPVAVSTAIFLPLLVQEFSSFAKYSKLSLVIIPLQIALLLSNPWKDPRNTIHEGEEKNMAGFFRYISSLPGEVWIPYRGYTQEFVHKGKYTEFNAMRDVFLVGDKVAIELRSELDSAFANHQWTYIFSEIPQPVPHYTLTGTMRNPNKMFINDDTLMYMYQPDGR